MAPRNQKDQQAAEVTQAAVDAPQASPADADIKGAEMASDNKDLAGGRTDGQILTSEPPAEADKSSYPVAADAKSHQPPVRSTRADVPIAVSMASGAGAHTPPDPGEYDAQGRPRD
jgi:hypothetical protein